MKEDIHEEEANNCFDLKNAVIDYQILCYSYNENSCEVKQTHANTKWSQQCRIGDDNQFVIITYN